jgi:tryptophan-rich sensory protein
VNSIVAATGLIGGKTTAQVSDAYPTLVTPAGYVFSIWSVIYVLLGVFAIAQALPRGYARVYREKIGWLFVLSCIFNIAWLFLWQFELLPASVVVMFLLLSTIILIYTRLEIGRSTVKPWE